MLQGDDLNFEVTMRSLRLAPGNYCCGVAIGSGDKKTGHVNFDVVHDVLYFEIRPEKGIDDTMSIWGSGWGCVEFPTPHQKTIQ